MTNTRTTECEQARIDIVADERGRLTSMEHEALRKHLAGCAACADLDRAERALTEALLRRLPQHPASLSLKSRLAARWLPDDPPAPRVRWRGSVRAGVPWLVTAVAAVAAIVVVRRAPDSAPLVAEAVNDHLRLLDGERPLEVRSTDFHQVKPWFAGHIEFAPAVTYTGDADFVLEGGAVSRFLDERAASLLFHRRQHRISLFILPARDARWPTGNAPQLAEARGFTVVLWRRRDFGYALASDLGSAELLELQRRIAASP